MLTAGMLRMAATAQVGLVSPALPSPNTPFAIRIQAVLSKIIEKPSGLPGYSRLGKLPYDVVHTLVMDH